MSTRGCIARITGADKFTGVYHHWDGYPSGGLGETLVELYCGHFAGDLDKMLATLIDHHPAGWSTINKADFNLPAGYQDGTKYHKKRDKETGRMTDDYSRPIPYGPVCFCHGQRKESGQKVTETTDAGTEWTYAFDEANHAMHVLARMHKDSKGHQHKSVGMFGSINREGTYWQDVGTIDLKSALQKTAAPDWATIECGKAFERCHHYAWYHFPELTDTPSGELSTGVYIGRDPLDYYGHAAAVLIGGVRYTMGRSGHGDGQSSYASLVRPDGERVERLIAVRGVGEKFKPAPGVAWVMPPTLVKPEETIIRAKQKRSPKPAAAILGHELPDMTGRKYRAESAGD